MSFIGLIWLHPIIFILKYALGFRRAENVGEKSSTHGGEMLDIQMREKCDRQRNKETKTAVKGTMSRRHVRRRRPS